MNAHCSLHNEFNYWKILLQNSKQSENFPDNQFVFIHFEILTIRNKGSDAYRINIEITARLSNCLYTKKVTPSDIRANREYRQFEVGEKLITAANL